MTPSPVAVTPMEECPVAATNSHELSTLKRSIFIVSQFERSEVRNGPHWLNLAGPSSFWRLRGGTAS